MAPVTLYQFEASHYNEKARWALDWKAVAHERVSLLPGPHALRIRRLTGGTQTPVLVDGERVVAGSAAILAHLERRFPEPPLEPADPVAREQARAITERFDREVGPAIRLAKFHEVLSAGWALRTFCAGRSPAVRAAYRAAFPVIAQVMRRSMGIDAARAERARVRTLEALEFVAKEAGAGGYLVGDRFGVADLTCAALLMPAVDLSELGGPAVAATEAESAWLARWAAHPGVEWVRTIYRRHRDR